MKNTITKILLFIIFLLSIVWINLKIFRGDLPYLAFITITGSVIILIYFISLTSCNRPEPNFEGVLMTNYGRDGLASFSTVTGAQGPLWFGSELYQVPMFEQKADCDAVRVSAK